MEKRGHADYQRCYKARISTCHGIWKLESGYEMEMKDSTISTWRVLREVRWNSQKKRIEKEKPYLSLDLKCNVSLFLIFYFFSLNSRNQRIINQWFNKWFMFDAWYRPTISTKDTLVSQISSCTIDWMRNQKQLKICFLNRSRESLYLQKENRNLRFDKRSWIWIWLLIQSTQFHTEHYRWYE